MKLFLLRKSSLKKVFMLSVTMAVLHFLTMQYILGDDIQNVDMSVLSGHSITIDPGHGGIDSGATANEVDEKDVTLLISMKLATLLEQYGGKVVLTRDKDIDYYTKGKGGKRNDLLERVKRIEESKADVFLSIHCNAYRGANLTGAQVFYNPQLEENKILAERLQQVLKQFPPGNKRQAKEDSHILLLKQINTPGVLIETGYLTSKEEALLLTDENYQQKMVENIAKALAYHFYKNAAK
ncbi:N-acetylmuramoyl-L-alanine amidase [Pelosinus sp. UFO1]|uniref:N-acetylmuramoyl-L-alanine amidase n=1 Tax=Pelosinus sp. UFO1 TaxID=484770 RepID=UPI0004D1E8DC|nr:N-acetylmuramoyl-L-alanine amidase [Pelosinus sp. UFO1]AIF50163.1 cell wall hydrolase/autolysin [Pelosinus sp. UFO1]